MNLQDAKELFFLSKSNDPYKAIAPALLNKWDIIQYVQSTGMIFPFYENDLKGITYDARLMGECVFWDYDETQERRRVNRINLQKRGDKIIIKPNTIVFVSLEPYFQIPEYVALRYNFKINNIYKGLLLGTGPIIDPGFTGYLSIPIHNLTDNTYELVYNEPLISIEFTKVNPYKQSNYKSASLPAQFQKTKVFTERSVEDYINQALASSQGQTSEDFGVVNSVPAIEEAIRKTDTFRNEIKEETNKFCNKTTEEVEKIRVKTDRNVKIGLISGVAALLLAVITLIIPTWLSLDSIQRERVEYRYSINEYNEKIKGLEYRLLILEIGNNERQLELLQKEYGAIADKSSNEAIQLDEKSKAKSDEIENLKKQLP